MSARRKRRLTRRLLPAVTLLVAAIAIVTVLASGGGRARAASTVSAGGVINSVAHAAKKDPTLKPHQSVTIEWVGDMAMSTELGLPPGGVYGALAPVSGLLKGPFITTGNLEGTLSSGGVSPKCGTDVASNDCYAFQAPPSYAHGLRARGFRLVNQANNHSMDYGESGRQQTIAALKSAGVKETGYPDQITYVTARDGVKVAFLGFAPYAYDSELLDIGKAQSMVRRARKHAALVVVIIHAGAEGADEDHVPQGTETYLGEDRGNSRAFTHAVIKAGASMVVGSGPHVIRGIENFHGHVIAYSLGNFVGYHTLGSGGTLDDSAVLRVKLGAGGKVLAARWIPVELDSGLPHPDPSDTSVALVRQLSAEDFPHDHWRLRKNGTFILKKQ